MGFAPENQVRTGLTAGGSRIRTTGFGVLIAISEVSGLVILYYMIADRDTPFCLETGPTEFL
jgi:hypothetical protein